MKRRIGDAMIFGAIVAAAVVLYLVVVAVTHG